MKKKKKKIILILLGILAFYFFVPVPFITKNQQFSIQESALTFVYNQLSQSFKEHVKVFYLEIGKGKLFDSFIDMGDGSSYLSTEDPSTHLLTKIQRWPHKIEPGSNFHPADPNAVVVVNEYGEPGLFLSVGPIIKSMGLAQCRTGYWGGGLCSAEYETLLIWTPLGWKHLFSLKVWQS